LNRNVEKAFRRFDRHAANGTDGMDVGICLIDKRHKEILYSGARRPLTLLRKDTVEQFSGTRRSIGEHFLTDEKPFEETCIPIDAETICYLYSDGLQDQFGGPDHKRLMRKGLEQWLYEAGSMDLDRTREQLLRYFIEWKGDNAQVDDICVIGFKI